MKNLSLFISTFALCASTSYAAINCGTLPTCESLGYTDTVSQCPKKSIKCPFDVTKGTCLHEAAVGEIAYFTKDPGKGWLLCDGQTITKAVHPELYAFLGQQFCTEDHGGTCGTDVGRVPDYRGFFLRVALPLKKSLEELKQQTGAPTASDIPPNILLLNVLYGNAFKTNTKSKNIIPLTVLETPQKEGLPNITGSFCADDSMVGKQDKVATKDWLPTGAFKDISPITGYDIESSNNHTGYQIKFSAQNSNDIYGSSTGVTPVNYAVYAYIYAGKIVSQ